MSWRQKLRGFYAVLERDDPDLARLLLRYASVLQLRVKEASTADLLSMARVAKRLAKAAGALFIVNDRVDIALAVGADGAHLGQDDLPLVAARKLASPPFVLGISTHNLDQVRDAVRDGADYLGHGPIFATQTKANPEPVQGLEALARAVATARPVPVVAIGGITPDRAQSVAAAGAAAACAISAVNQARDVANAARQIAAFWPSLAN